VKNSYSHLINYHAGEVAFFIGDHFSQFSLLNPHYLQTNPAECGKVCGCGIVFGMEEITPHEKNRLFSKLIK
jgi:hypothetical protein